MSEINITRNKLLRNHTTDIYNAFRGAHLGDTIKLHGRKIAIGSRGVLPVDTDIYVTSARKKHPTTIALTNHQIAFFLNSGNLHLSYVNILLSAQSAGVIANQDKYGSGNLSMDHVTIKHTGKFPSREYFNSINMSTGASQDPPYVNGTVKITNSQIDDAQIACSNLIVSNSSIGRLDGMGSTLESPNLVINNDEFTHLLIRDESSSRNPVQINNIKTAGMMTLQGNITVNGLAFMNGVRESSRPLGFLGFGVKPIDVLISYKTININGAKDQNGKYIMPMVSLASMPNVISQIKLVNMKFDKSWQYLRSNNAIVSPYWLNINKVNATLANKVDRNNPGSKIFWPTPLGAKNYILQGSMRMVNIDDKSHWVNQDADVTNGGGSSSELLEQLPLDSLKNGNQVHSHSAIDELNSKIGLKPVKEKLSQIISTAQVVKRRKAMHEPTSPMSLHMIFEGNPGTGKTMVARLVGKALYEGGVLKSDNFKEVEANDLIAGYVGQSASRTKQIVEQALGGVLFIDEAYELGDVPGQNNSFKHSAVAQLIAMMENHRDELVVILAGYTYQMNRFLNTGNSGLKSRFPNIIKFPNYSSVEMAQIMQLMMKHDKIHWKDNQTARLLVTDLGKLTSLYGANGNGRLVRNFVQQMEMDKDYRISKEAHAMGKSIASGDFDRELSIVDTSDVDRAYHAVIRKNKTIS